MTDVPIKKKAFGSRKEHNVEMIEEIRIAHPQAKERPELLAHLQNLEDWHKQSFLSPLPLESTYYTAL